MFTGHDIMYTGRGLCIPSMMYIYTGSDIMQCAKNIIHGEAQPHSVIILVVLIKLLLIQIRCGFQNFTIISHFFSSFVT